MPTQVHIGIVTNNLVGPDGVPFQQGEVMFQCLTLLSDGSEYPAPAVPRFMNADPLGFGVFFVPEVGATIEIEVDATLDYVLDTEVTYRGFLYNSVNDIPTEFKTNYPYRKGCKFKSGIFMFDDTVGQQLIQLFHVLGHGFELTPEGDVNWLAQRDVNWFAVQDYVIDTMRDMLFTVLNEFIVSAVGKLGLSSASEVEITADLTASLKSSLEAVIDAPLVKIGSSGAAEPLVLGNQLKTYLESIVSYLTSHTHSGVTTGTGSSGAPATPPPVPATILSTKVTGE